MRPRVELALGLAAFVGFGALVLAEALTAREGTLDARLSSFRAEPNGARAFADGALRLGHPVIRWRRPLSALPEPDTARALLAVLAPDHGLDYSDQAALRKWSGDGGDLLIVGRTAYLPMLCEGWRWDSLPAAGIPATGTIGDVTVQIPAVRARLTPTRDPLVVDSTRTGDLGTRGCGRGWRGEADTLLRGPTGTVLAVRRTTKRGSTITLVADASLFTNQALRETEAGEFALALLPARGPLYVDEYHHDYGTSRSLTGVILAWSGESPAGWVLWQAAAVGVLLLLASMVRNGPLRALPVRSRRSSLEHVGALARTLAATKGHDVAVRSLVSGLRRRLSADGRPSRDDPRQWLEGLKDGVRSGAARRAVQHLLELTRPGQGATQVLAAANAVEEIWQELRP